ncbi:MAG TPA: response regulator [Terriglobia bacterium]|nr:response regulator [Terriglobia bacterium]
MPNDERLILVVDDFEANRELYAYVLSDAGFKVALASDGQQALDQAFQLRPDLIIMDLALPLISGPDAARRLKADEQTRHIPIIVITAYDPPKQVDELGCDAVLTKPCMPADMLAAINSALDASERTKHGEPPASVRQRNASGSP